MVAISSQDVYRARDIIWQRETGIIEPTPLAEESPWRSQLDEKNYGFQQGGIALC